MKKILGILAVAALLMAMGCGASVKVTNSTSAAVTCELTSSSSAIGENTPVLVAAGAADTAVKAKKAKSTDHLSLYYWWDGADDYATSTSVELYLGAGVAAPTAPATYDFRSSKNYTISSDLVKNASVKFPATTDKSYLYYNELVITQ